MVIKAVLFDYGGTLVHHKTQETIIKEHELIVKYLNKLGCKITREEFDVKTKKLKDDYDNWKHKTHLEIRPEKFWLHAFKVLGIKGNMKMAKEIQKIRVRGHKDILFPGAVTVLKKLKKFKKFV